MGGAERVWAQGTQTEEQTGGLRKGLPFSGGLHPAQGSLGVGQQNDSRPSRQWGKGRTNRAGVAEDRVSLSDAVMEP